MLGCTAAGCLDDSKVLCDENNNFACVCRGTSFPSPSLSLQQPSTLVITFDPPHPEFVRCVGDLSPIVDPISFWDAGRTDMVAEGVNLQTLSFSGVGSELIYVTCASTLADLPTTQANPAALSSEIIETTPSAVDLSDSNSIILFVYLLLSFIYYYFFLFIDLLLLFFSFLFFCE